MPDTIKELESTTIEGAVGAFDAFCEDIAGMFGVTVEGTGGDQKLVTIKELKTDFKKVTAVFIVESKGSVNGSYYVILDQDALFTLAGTFVMLPEKVITQNRKTGREKEANEIGDAVGEVGNLLVGAWDKFFREEIEGHVHFLQTGTFIGKPWLKPEENIGLTKETELIAVKYDMTIEPFPPFVCMAAFPTSVFEAGPEEEENTEQGQEEATEDAKEQASEEVKEEKPAEAPEAVAEETKTEPPAEESKPAETEEPAAEAETPVEETKNEEAAKEEPPEEVTEEAAKEETPAEVAEETAKEETPAEVTEEAAKEEPPAEVTEEAAKEEPEAATDEAEPAEETAESPQEESVEETATESTTEKAEEPTAEDRPVTKVIEQMTQSPAVLPGEITGDFLTEITAKNVMRTDIAWANQDETVENVLTKMQEQNTGYALIGQPGSIEGIVSKSDIQGALSPYLQAIFSKWKRELDTATLQIKVRWIMSRPVHTLRPDATLAMITETMCKHSVRALPVADENGTCGIVTAYTIFNALNTIGADQASQQGQNTDVPALS